jgi:hypothetical protein
MSAIDSAPAEARLTISTGGGATSTPGLAGFATTGAMMNGLPVTAEFSNDPTAPGSSFAETPDSAATGAASGGVENANGWWGLSLDGNSFATPWNFTINPNANLGRLKRLTLDARDALTVFDRNYPGQRDTGEGTPGSANGNDFNCSGASVSEVCGSNTFDGFAEYTFDTQVGILGPVGDHRHVQTVTFFRGESPSGPTGSWQFVQDTDDDSRLSPFSSQRAVRNSGSR